MLHVGGHACLQAAAGLQQVLAVQPSDWGWGEVALVIPRPRAPHVLSVACPRVFLLCVLGHGGGGQGATETGK